MLFCYHLIHVGLLQTKLQWMRFLYDFEVSWSIGFVFDPPLQVVMLGGFERYTHILDYDIIPSRSSWCKVAPFILVMHTLTLLYSTLLYSIHTTFAHPLKVCQKDKPPRTYYYDYCYDERSAKERRVFCVRGKRRGVGWAPLVVPLFSRLLYVNRGCRSDAISGYNGSLSSLSLVLPSFNREEC